MNSRSARVAEQNRLLDDMLNAGPTPEPTPTPTQAQEGDGGLNAIVEKRLVQDEDRRVTDDVRMIAVHGGIIESAFLNEDELLEGLSAFAYEAGLETFDADVIRQISDATEHRMRALVETLADLASRRSEGVRQGYTTRSREKDNPRRVMTAAQDAMGSRSLPPAPRKVDKGPVRQTARQQAADGSLGVLALHHATQTATKVQRRGHGHGGEGLLPATTVKHADRRIGIRDAIVVLLNDVEKTPMKRSIVIKAMSNVE